MLMGYLVVTAVLVVGLGRLGDMHGRVRIYNLGFLIFAARRRWRSPQHGCRATRRRGGSSAGASSRASAGPA
jgi:hypothetical protein